jgi:O-acetyl-ADP-ribose deacetylase (regulator of RNase III)
MKIKYVEGDLFGPAKEASKDNIVIISHVVNNKGAFGAGFVLHLSKHFPKVKDSYYKWSSSGQLKLGEVLFVDVGLRNELKIANMCAQTLGGERPLYYNALAKCMDTVGQEAEKHKAVIIAPAFGTNLAGGDFKIIEQLMQDCWIRDKNLDVTIHYLPGTLPEIENLRL